MDHQVLARKWRPRTFQQMVGQEHVLKALINALDNNRLHHAYLFTGTRGVGKTTIARILAKCLNCDQGVTSQPCDQCPSCVEINEGRCVDLIEVDAASRTKVEDTRELLENVQYLPTRTRYKVYLIDEVHMLSGHSFNALLKTLEEPPEHVKFLLATTDPQKLPVTILSRCLQFNLKNMSPERVAEHLKYVLGEENIPYEEAALWQLGRAADGSMRDALSLTDQAIAFGENSVLEADVSTMLGSIDRGRVHQIFDALLASDAAAILDNISDLAAYSPDYAAVLEELISLLHRIAVTQAVPGANYGDISEAEKTAEYAQQISAEDLQLYYQIALIGRRDLPLNPDAKAGLEMVLLRMLAFTPVDSDQPETHKKKLVTDSADNGGYSPSKPSQGSSTSTHTTATALQSVASSPAGQSKAAQALALARGQTQVENHAQPAARTKLDLVVDNDVAGVTETAPKQENPESQPKADKREATPEKVASSRPEQEQVSKSKPSESAAEQTADSSTPIKDKAAKVSERFALASLNSNDDWIKLAHLAPLKGMTRNILMQCGFVSCEEGSLNLLIDPQYIDLLNASHQSRIEQALTETLDTAVKVAVKAGTVTEETPAAWDQRINAERLQAARESLESDENVQHWVIEFGATLEIDSIKPLDD